MSTLRQRLPRFAALVLLVWLFATGVAFAHTCTTEVYVPCDDCCAEMKAMEAWAEPVAINANAAAAQAEAALPAPVVLAFLAWEPATAAAPWPVEPSDPGGGRPIPIFFLRLAL